MSTSRPKKSKTAKPQSPDFFPSSSPHLESVAGPGPSAELIYPSFSAEPSIPPTSAWYNLNYSSIATFSPSTTPPSPILAKPLGRDNWPYLSALTCHTEEELRIYKKRLEFLEVFRMTSKKDIKPVNFRGVSLRELFEGANREMKGLIDRHVERKYGTGIGGEGLEQEDDRTEYGDVEVGGLEEGSEDMDSEESDSTEEVDSVVETRLNLRRRR